MLLVVRDEDGILIQGDAGDLQVKVADDLAGLLELGFELSEIADGSNIVWAAPFLSSQRHGKIYFLAGNFPSLTASH
jgi:hypothetical protein